MATKVIKLQNNTDTLLPVSDAKYIQMSVDGVTKSVHDVILEDEEVTAAGYNNLNDRLEELEGSISSIEETDPTVPSYVKSITEENISYWNDAEPSALWLDVEYNNNAEIYEIVQDIEFSYISDAWNEHRDIYITYEGAKYSCIYCGEYSAEFNYLNGNDKSGVTIVNRTIVVEQDKNGVFCRFNEYQLKENSTTIKIIDFTQDGNTTYTVDGKTITYLTTVENFDEIQDYIAITKKGNNNDETNDGVIYGKYNNTCIPLTVELDTNYTNPMPAMPGQGTILNYKNCILGHIINSRNYINEITWIKDTVIRGGKLGQATITNTYTCIFSEYPNITSLDDYVTYTQTNSYYQPIGDYVTQESLSAIYLKSQMGKGTVVTDVTCNLSYLKGDDITDLNSIFLSNLGLSSGNATNAVSTTTNSSYAYITV